MTEPARRPVRQLAPAELGVHQAGPLSAYIRRPHDKWLRAVLDPETEYSRLVVIRGDALTGTSRAVYEAVTAVLADWVVEIPPTASALAARLEAGIPGRTVLWLGDLRHYADADGGAAILGRLDNVLEDVGPVVAIATIWPGYWDSYAAAAATGRGAADPAAVAGRMLAPLDELAYYAPDSHDAAYGGVIDVPAVFTADEVTAAAEAGDPVLAAAAAGAGPDGQVTQYLAGARDLLARYAGPDADPYGQAIITAALDAARLGHASPLPAALLRDAAVGYLPGQQHPAGWRDTALDCGWALQAEPGGYRVVGYLDQHGRRTRADQLGPASLWDALAAHTAGASDLGRLAQAAQDRGLYRHAAALWTSAARAGQADAARNLVAHLGARAEPADVARAGRWAAGQAPLDEPWDVARLLEALGADAAQVLLARDPAGRVSLDHRWDVPELLRSLQAAGAAEAARALVARVAGQVSLRNPRYLVWLLRAAHDTGAAGALHALTSRIASGAGVKPTRDATELLAGLHAVGAADAIRTMAPRVVEAVDVEDPYDVAARLNALHGVGAEEQIRALLARDPGRHASLGRTGGVADLLAALQAVGADDAVRALADRAAAEVSLEDGEYVARLLRVLRSAGADDAIQVLLARDPATQVQLMFPEDVAQMIEALRTAGAGAAVDALASRIADQVDVYYLWDATLLTALRAAGAWDAIRALSAYVTEQPRVDDPGYVAELLDELREAGSADGIAALLACDPAGQASLDDAWDVASLLIALDAAQASDTVRALAARAATQAGLDDLRGVARLLAALRAAGAGDAARILAARSARDAGLGDAEGVARLLEELGQAGAGDSVHAVLARNPGRLVAIDASQPFRPGYQRAFARLLAALRAAGAADAERDLALRAADAGMFGLFLDTRPDQAASYRFGREPDGTPSPPWTWSEPA
jgi:hypothetical protein